MDHSSFNTDAMVVPFAMVIYFGSLFSGVLDSVLKETETGFKDHLQRGGIFPYAYWMAHFFSGYKIVSLSLFSFNNKFFINKNGY